MSDTLNKYEVYIKLTVVGENIEDAIEYVEHAIDASDLLGQDGICSIEITEDIELLDTEKNGNSISEEDFSEFSEFYKDEDLFF